MVGLFRKLSFIVVISFKCLLKTSSLSYVCRIPGTNNFRIQQQRAVLYRFSIRKEKSLCPPNMLGIFLVSNSTYICYPSIILEFRVINPPSLKLFKCGSNLGYSSVFHETSLHLYLSQYHKRTSSCIFVNIQNNIST